MEYYNSYYEGVFWIPEKENSKTIATLHIDENGVVTISSLEPLNNNQNKRLVLGENNKISILLGCVNNHDTSKNHIVKLYEVFQIHQSDGALMKFKYQSSNSLISKTFNEDIDNLSYNTIMLNSNLISQWVPITGFKRDSNRHEYKNFKVNQLYEQPKKIDLFQNKDYKIYIFFRASAGYAVRRSSYIKEEVFVIIETTSSHELKQLYKIKATIERLFNIILFIPFYSTIVEFKSTTGTDYRDLSKNRELSKSRSNPLKFELFCEKSQELFEKWFDKQELFELFISNFFSVFGQKGVLVENKFLTYVSVLENYHKNNVRKTAKLKDRLIYILDSSNVINSRIDIDKYAEKLKVTRNYHAHLEEKHEEKSFDLDGIIKSNRLLEIIIHEIMLRELGISEFKMPQSTVQLIMDINENLG